MGLECVELVISWEQAFGITIPNAVASTLITPEHAADAIDQLVKDAGKEVPRYEIEKVIKQTTLEISGMKEANYRTNGRFVQDFGLG